MGDELNRSLPPRHRPGSNSPLEKWWSLSRMFLRWFGFCLVAGISLALITVLYLKSKPLPPPQLGLTTRILDSRGNLIDTLDHGERRDPVQLKEFPRSIQEATLDSGRSTILRTPGVLPQGDPPAVWINLKKGRVSQGASTITQQLARNLYLTHDRTWSRKWREAVLTTQLEIHFSKKEILEMF